MEKNYSDKVYRSYPCFKDAKISLSLDFYRFVSLGNLLINCIRDKYVCDFLLFDKPDDEKLSVDYKKDLISMFAKKLDFFYSHAYTFEQLQLLNDFKTFFVTSVDSEMPELCDDLNLWLINRPFNSSVLNKDVLEKIVKKD